jgi:hypothetical protein
MSDPRAPRLVQRVPSPAAPPVGGFAAEYPAHAAALDLLATAVPQAERLAFRASIVEWVRDATISIGAEVPAWVRAYLEERA